MNVQQQKTQKKILKEADLKEHFKLLDLALEFGDEDHKKEVKGNIERIINTEDKEENEDVQLARAGLPREMAEAKVQELVNAYNDAHEDVRTIVLKINSELKQSMPYQQMRDFFKEVKNQTKNETSYDDFNQAHHALEDAEKALNSYCEDEETYKNYINLYYKKNKWFAFQPSSAGENNTSMVDVAAKFLNKRIIIYQYNKKQKHWKEIYRTQNSVESQEEIHIEYNGDSHFIKLAPNPKYDKVEKKSEKEDKEKLEEKGSANEQVLKEIEEKRRSLEKLEGSTNSQKKKNEIFYNPVLGSVPVSSFKYSAYSSVLDLINFSLVCKASYQNTRRLLSSEKEKRIISKSIPKNPK